MSFSFEDIKCAEILSLFPLKVASLKKLIKKKVSQLEKLKARYVENGYENDIWIYTRIILYFEHILELLKKVDFRILIKEIRERK